MEIIAYVRNFFMLINLEGVNWFDLRGSCSLELFGVFWSFWCLCHSKAKKSSVGFLVCSSRRIFISMSVFSYTYIVRKLRIM